MKKKIGVVLVLLLIIAMALSACGHTHEFGEWTITKAATCTEDGERERTCSCGEKETEVIKATGHSFKEATCTEPKTCTVCGATEGTALGHTTTTGVCERCGKSFKKWDLSYYVDEFNKPTDEWYISNVSYINGTFSNSATTNSKLTVLVLVDANDTAFIMYEYGSHMVKNSSSRYVDDYDIVVLDDSGTKHNMTGTVYCGGDRLFIDDKYKKSFTDLMQSQKKISVYIVMSDRQTTTYLFDIECSNFGELYKSKVN